MTFFSRNASLFVFVSKFYQNTSQILKFQFEYYSSRVITPDSARYCTINSRIPSFFRVAKPGRVIRRNLLCIFLWTRVKNDDKPSYVLQCRVTQRRQWLLSCNWSTTFDPWLSSCSRASCKWKLRKNNTIPGSRLPLSYFCYPLWPKWVGR